MQNEKEKRERERNWDMTEKEIFRQLLDHQKDVIENKSNDTKMIGKKKAAWESIKIQMNAAGYNRSVEKLKSQWTRLKVAAKRSHTETKKAVKATGNVVPLPNCYPFDCLVQGMIYDQLQEDTIFMDSNTEILPVQEDDELPCTSASAFIIQSNDAVESDITSPLPVKQAPSTTENVLSNLRKLPKKKKTKIDVMTSRANQIEEGTSNAANLHLLQMEHAKNVLILDGQLLFNAKDENSRAREKHLLEIDQIKEVHRRRMAEF